MSDSSLVMSIQEITDLTDALKLILGVASKCNDKPYTPTEDAFDPPPFVSSLWLDVNTKHYPVTIVEIRGEIENHEEDYKRIVSCLRDIQECDMYLVLDLKRVTYIGIKVAADIVQTFASWSTPFMQSFCVMPPRSDQARTAMMVAKAVFGFTAKDDWFYVIPSAILEHNNEVDKFLKEIKAL
jgi:hypothetical protein